MTMTDDELIERVRSTLREWADEAPVSNRGGDGDRAAPRRRRCGVGPVSGSRPLPRVVARGGRGRGRVGSP